MPPKRTTATVDTAPKRIKALSYDSNDDNDEQPTGRPSRKAAQKEVRYQEVNIDDYEDDDEPLVRNYKQPRPKPKKKGLSSTVKAASEPKVVKSKQQPNTTTDLTKAPSASLAKAPSTSSKAPTASLIKPTSALPPSSILKTKANWNQENQENKAITSNSNSGSNKTTDSGKGMKKPASVPSMSADQLSAALEDLKLKYKRLQQLRMTDAEKNLEDCRTKLEEATHSAENYRAQIEPQLESALRNQEKLRENNEILNAKVRTLQRQVREYEEKNRLREQEERLKAKTASMESILASPDATLPSTAKASTISLYENLSGLKILPRDVHTQSSKEKQPTTWDCEHSGPRGTLRFSLTYDNKSNKVSYTPYIDEKRDKELLEHLPDYLTDEIEFERQFEARFFWRMLSFNNDDARRE
ncbi:hypothetical protein BGX34_010200 [Mortierella sp. NVP85]|nr:hypothetical protein BGX34_010200 [Mortierella sp. NVP85]